MIMDFYCHPTCTTCKKARRWLDEQNIAYRFINLKETPPSKESLVQAMEDSDKPIRQFFNTSGNRYRELNLKDKVPAMGMEEAAGVLAEDGMLLKRPLAVRGDKVTIGFKENEYEKVWKNE